MGNVKYIRRIENCCIGGISLIIKPQGTEMDTEM